MSTPPATATGARDDRGVDEGSPRWFTAVHEAGHATAADALRVTVASCRVARDGHTGHTRHNATGADAAVVAVAGERATCLLLGEGGGAHTDYRMAAADLADTGHDLLWAENRADDLLRIHRRDLQLTARWLYRTGGR